VPVGKTTTQQRLTERIIKKGHTTPCKFKGSKCDSFRSIIFIFVLSVLSFTLLCSFLNAVEDTRTRIITTKLAVHPPLPLPSLPSSFPPHLVGMGA
jgi:hypothetical protein